MAFIKCPLAVDRGFPSLFAHTQTSLFKNIAFEANFSIAKNTRITLKAAKEDTSAPGHSNVTTSDKAYMPTVNKYTSVQAVLSDPISYTSRTSALIKTSKKYQDKVDKTEALKKEKEKSKTTTNEQKQVRCPSCGGTDHSRSSSKLCPMNKSKTKFSNLKDTVEKFFVIKASLANICKHPKFVTLIQEVVDHITQLVYSESIFAG
ncbi:hypothetical protein BCV72DRAFT_315274 [Rhizopus microsporus var. microsporus]|uniref:Uncharacterized protein n=1 Tax=Rhizopus microsporus var. microsporus TaxID=86635 RepID=A0A1X0RE09_RHIZD|nr:hypothetical protein BCV72DRAFT_315274 [Rhizopus microsporus var. microsporus]